MANGSTNAGFDESPTQVDQRFRAFVESAKDIVFELDLEGFFTYVSPHWTDVLGHAVNDVRGQHFASFVHPDDLPLCAAFLQKVVETGQKQLDVEYRVRHQNGSWYWHATSGSPLSGADGRIQSFLGYARDISERKQVQAKLQLAASVFSHARAGITITDAHANIIEVNDSFTRITGYSREEALGQNPRILQSGRQSPEFYLALWKALADKGYWHGEVWNQRKSGEVYAEILTISAVRDANDKTLHYVALFTDITPMKQRQQELEHIAHCDALTGLPNRVLLADRLQQGMLHSQRRGQMLAVAYLDLDGFKQVNDTHGHKVGDELLIALAQRMKAALREGDTLARIGGDEFVAVMVDLEGPQDCQPMLDRLLQAASQSIVLGDTVVQVSTSIGVALYPQAGADADLLLRQADHAMYLAKHAGKNCYHVFDAAGASQQPLSTRSAPNWSTRNAS